MHVDQDDKIRMILIDLCDVCVSSRHATGNHLFWYHFDAFVEKGCQATPCQHQGYFLQSSVRLEKTVWTHFIWTPQFNIMHHTICIQYMYNMHRASTQIHCSVQAVPSLLLQCLEEWLPLQRVRSSLSILPCIVQSLVYSLAPIVHYPSFWWPETFRRLNDFECVSVYDA